ncbi:MAG: homocitrate synthase [Deltaproteobacteria bacterium]|nr:homocitrate synthase [Deltaproteobacteria bacterium]
MILVDTTLRDGEQAPGIAFTIDEKVEIAQALSAIGIREIEAGTPVMGGDELEAVKAILGLKLPAKVFTWNRALEKDIEASLSCGVKNLYISCPVSDLQIEKKLRKTKSWVKDRFAKLIPALKKEGCYIACGLEDASMADISFVLELSHILDRLKVDRIRICDTVGILTPFKTFELIAYLKRHVNIPLEIHTHNDFGMATANSLAGIKGGAEYASVTVNGMGERAGNASLEELVMALERLEGVKTSIDTKRLKQLSLLVARFAGRPIHPAKPIVGDMTFSHESGIHVDGVIKEPSCYEPFSPETVGASRQILIGKHSGINSIIYRFKVMNVFLSREMAAELLFNIRNMAEEKKRSLLDMELMMLYHNLLENGVRDRRETLFHVP